MKALKQLDREPRLKLIVLAVIAFCLSFIPLLSSLLGWFETFFHELSHGIVALLTGASILSIELSWNGSGLIRYAGSHAPALVNFSGYPGAVLCGIGLYLAALNQSKGAHNLALGLAGLIAISAILWMRDLTSLVIAGLMMALLWALWRWTRNLWAKLALELIAVYLMIGGIHSIWSIFGLVGRGDAKSLAELTWLPAFVFPPIWLGLGFAALWWLWHRDHRRSARKPRR